MIRVVTTRAPGQVGSLLHEMDEAKKPVILVPSHLTLACEMEVIRHSPHGGILGRNIFSPTSLVQEIRDLCGVSFRSSISPEGESMVLSRVLHHVAHDLKYYQDAVSQPSLAKKMARQIRTFKNARLTPGYLESYEPASRRTRAKMHDVTLVWDHYQDSLVEGYMDTPDAWNKAMEYLDQTDLFTDGATLLIYGFSQISPELVTLIGAASRLCDVVVGLVCDSVGEDREIFRTSDDSLRSMLEMMRLRRLPVKVEAWDGLPKMDPGIAYIEKTVFAYGPFQAAKYMGPTPVRDDPAEVSLKSREILDQTPVPDLSHVRVYYAKSSYVECLHACQTLLAWHQKGIHWDDMAVLLCEDSTLPSLLPMVLTSAGIPFNAKNARGILRTDYGQYVYSLLRILRRGYRQSDVLRLMKTGLTGIDDETVMDLENHALANGIDRRRWLRPFRIPQDPRRAADMEALEEIRKGLIDPIETLRQKLRHVTGREAAGLIYEYIVSQNIYDQLLLREERFIEERDTLSVDTNRQVWDAVNDMLDEMAAFIGSEVIPLDDLCSMLEAAMSTRTIRSVPQFSGAVTLSLPDAVFSSGVRCVVVMGMQEQEIPDRGMLLSEAESMQLESFIRKKNNELVNTFRDMPISSLPSALLGKKALDMAAEGKQIMYRAISLAREELVLSAASAKPSGAPMIPSTAFKRISQLVRSSQPDNVTGGLMDDGLLPFSPTFALERLGIMLREHHPFLAGDTPSDRAWRSALAELYQKEPWKPRMEGVLSGLHVSVHTSGISPEQAERLARTDNISISRIQTYRTCPYMDFTGNQLHLWPNAVYAFQPNERGTFFHAVLKRFFDEAIRLPGWPNIDERAESALMERIIREETKPWKDGILNADILHRYQGAEIVRSIRTTISSLMRSFREETHFRPIGLEVGFGTAGDHEQMHFPPVTLELSSGGKIGFSGVIDRVDTLELQDGRRFFLVVDNKSSSREMRENSLVAGLQLQLPLYVLAAQQGLPGYQAAGSLYQPVQDVLIPSESPEEIVRGIDKELRPKGMILQDKLVQEAASPLYVPSRRSQLNDVISAVSPEEMETITGRAVEIVTETVEDIRKGFTSPRPVQDGQTSPCAFCNHPDACPFDTHMPEGRILEVTHRQRLILA